jgi:NitT/TauT family transport system substrate-binding protein
MVENQMCDKRRMRLMRKITARYLGLAAGLVVAGLVTQAHAQQTKNVRFILDWAFQGQQAPYTLSVDDGTFARNHLNVTVDRGVGSGDTVAKVASGAYDIGQADLYSMVRFNGENPDRQLIAVFIVNDKSALAVETMAESNIKVPKDLEGKTMASPVGDASRQLFPLFAEINHVDQKSIKWNNISPELREPMLLKGQADAITGNIPTVLLNMRGINVPESKIRLMPYVDYGVELYGLALVTRPDFAAKNPEVIRDFIRGTVHGMSVMIKDPAAAVASVKKRDPLLNADVETARIKTTLDYAIITPNVLQNGMSNVDTARLDRTLKQVAKAFEMKATPSAAQVYTDKYLPPRSDLKVAQ